MDAATDSLGALQTFGPLLGGFGLIIWLGWRLFWKVDRRSQLELAAKDKTIAARETRIASLEGEVETEKQKRFAAEALLAKANAREGSLETQIAELGAQVARSREEVRALREEVQLLRSRANG